MKRSVLQAILVGASVCPAAGTDQQDDPPPLRPPAVPLVACDPYFSIWSRADRLTDAPTTHWTGRRHSLLSLIRVGGRS